MQRHEYIVAGHRFAVLFGQLPFPHERLDLSFGPFEVPLATESSTNTSTLLTVKVVDEVRRDDIQSQVLDDQPDNPGMGRLDVYRTTTGWLFEHFQPFSDRANARIRIDQDFKQAELSLFGQEMQCWFAYNSALMLCYMLATMTHNTILTHSSCVVHAGKAYLFLGKSGTGKSTHSRLWLEFIADTLLLNDDHPIIRVDAQGEVTAYGSPWSGKTPCYKNLSAPVGGIVRIRRAPQNSIEKLGIAQAYASLTTSFSGMTWEPVLADGRHQTLAKIIGRVPCYTLSCRPDEEAARVCIAAVE